MSDKVELPNTTVEKETDRALLCDIDGAKVWVPKSQIHDDSEVYKGDTDGTLIVTRWWYEQHEEEIADTATTTEETAKPIRLTVDQREVFDRVLSHMRRHLCNPDMSEGRVVELIAAEYLGGVVEPW